MPSREHRTVRSIIRASDDAPGLFEAEVMFYGTVDDYDTVFDAGVFDTSLDTRLPRVTWGHDWSDVIGRVVDFKNTPESLTIVGQLDDFDAVPRARQAYAQLQSGTIDQFSVGFRRGETRVVDGRTHFVSATLDEVALVLAGAVPGTNLVGVRMVRAGGREVPESLVIALGEQVAAGTLTKDAAQVALDLAAGMSMAPSAEVSAGDGDPGLVAVPANTVLTADEADEILAALGLE